MASLEVGLISDTHDLLRPEARAALAGVDLILHAGDVCTPAVLEALGELAPVRAVRGNNDRGAWAAALPEARTEDLAGLRVHVLHDVKALALDPREAGVGLVLAGHSHRPRTVERDGVLYVDPGSAGPRRFTLPVCVARLTVTDGVPRVRLVPLDV